MIDTSVAARTLPGPGEPVLPDLPGRYTDAGGYHLYVRTAGGDGGEPAVMVHGLGGTSTNWTDLQHLLDDRLASQAPDLPGFGLSRPPTCGYRLDTHVRAVAALVSQWGRGPVHLFGNSLGGAVAVRLAAERPDLVRSLVLVAPALPQFVPRRTSALLPVVAVPGFGRLVQRRLYAASPELQVQRLIDLVYADTTRLDPQRLARTVREAAARRELPWALTSLTGSLQGLLSAYLESGGRNLWRQAAQIAVPTLLVFGTQDKLVPLSVAPRAERAFRDNRLHVLSGVGHVAQMEVPETVTGLVRAHLDRVAAAEAARR